MTTRIHLLTRPGHNLALAALALFFLAQNQPPTTAAGLPRGPQQQQLEPNPELIARVSGLLDSASGPDRAWGAYLAQKNGLKQFTPNLIDALKALADDESPDAWLATSAVIDSLLQLEADIPAGVIMSLNQRYTGEKVIMLARNPLANKDALLEVMRSNTGVAWRAAGNLLAAAKAPGLAALLLKDLRLSVTVLVVDPHSGGGVGSGNSVCGLSGLAMIAVPQEYPPIGLYGLAESPSRGFVVLAPGPRTVYYSRTVVSPGTRAPGPSSAPLYGRNEAIIEYLVILLAIPPGELGLKTEETYSEEWKGAAALTERLIQIRAQVTAKYQSVAARLIDAGLLTEPEWAELGPRIEIHLTDFRSNKSAPLPGSAG